MRPEDVARRDPSIDYRRLMFEPGDGRVTKPSALARSSLDLSRGRAEGSFPPASAVFLCSEHAELPGDIT
jgi:hypothetical protein